MIGNTGSHWEKPHLGSDKAGGGLYEEVPIDVVSRINRATVFFDFIDLFDLNAGAASPWLLTQLVAGGAIFSGAGNGGSMQLNCAAVDAQGIGSLQCNSPAWVASTSDSLDGMENRILSAGIRFSHSDFSVSNWFWGLAGTDTTLMGTTGLLLATGGDNCVGWHHIVDAVSQGGITGPDGNNVRMVSAGGGVANYEGTLLSAANVGPVPAPADASIDSISFDYGIKIIGTQNVEWYRNGRLVHRRRMSNAINAAMTLSFAAVSNGTDENWIIDYVWGSTSR